MYVTRQQGEVFFRVKAIYSGKIILRNVLLVEHMEILILPMVSCFMGNIDNLKKFVGHAQKKSALV
jgi:hypothetical protein